MAKQSPWSLIEYPDRKLVEPRTVADILRDLSMGNPVSVEELSLVPDEDRAVGDALKQSKDSIVPLPGKKIRVAPNTVEDAQAMRAGPEIINVDPELNAPGPRVGAMAERIRTMRDTVGASDPRYKTSANQNRKQDESISSGLVMTKGQWDSALQNLMQSDFYKRLDNGLAMEEQMLMRADTGPSQLDLSPLLALVDSETGSKLLAGYRKPETKLERLKRLQDYAGKVQDNRRDLAKAAMQAISSQKYGIYSSKLIDSEGAGVATQTPKATGLTAAQKDRNSRADMRNAQKFSTDFDKYTKDHREALSFARGSLASIDSGGATGQQAFRNMLARASGEKGPLSADDINRFSGDPSIVAGMQRVFSKYINGQPFTDEDAKDMKNLAHAYVDFHAALLQDSADLWANHRSQDYGLSPDEAWDRVQGKVSTGTKQSRPGAGAPAAGAKKSFTESLIEALKAQKAAKGKAK